MHWHLCPLPPAAEGDDLLADLRLFYCDTATFGESAANVQQVRRVWCGGWPEGGRREYTTATNAFGDAAYLLVGRHQNLRWR